MNGYRFSMSNFYDKTEPVLQYPEIVVVEPVTEPVPGSPARRARPARPWLPPLLFAVTCVTTYLVNGPAYCLALMTILGCHEMGHFLQAMRYRVPASLPYFIPMPIGPIGTMGAVIAMHPGMGNRRALFDIAITGPMAGLVPALFCCWYGLSLSEVMVIPEAARGLSLGEPLLFKWMSIAYFGHLQPGQDVVLHPIAFAGWVGLLLTALNLFPIGQLDGGHILYALLRRRARPVAEVLLVSAVVAVVVWGYTTWVLMLLLLMFMGAKHPPTANDHMPLGWGRAVLGWLALLFVLVGFTPTPFMF